MFISCFGITSVGFSKYNAAHYGVVLFFVLSGYLITYLLLKEKAETATINLKFFYFRRILRIWPIYFLIIFISIVIVALDNKKLIAIYPTGNLPQIYLMYMLMVPNIAFGIKMTVSIIAPLWSIGVEEQFYGIWPFLVKKQSNIIRALIFTIIIYFSVKLIARVTNSWNLYRIIDYTAISCMAIGGLGACIITQKQKLLKYIFYPAVQVLCWSILLITIAYKPIIIFDFFAQELYAIAFLIIIINISRNPKTIISLENKLFDFIGKISYGIYVYHFPLLFILGYFFKGFFPNTLSGYLIVYLILLVTTIATAYLSYNYIESRFLRKKHNFSIIESQFSRSKKNER